MSTAGIAVVAELAKGEIADITLEMLACGRELADASGSELVCIILTDNAEPFQALPLAAKRTVIVKDPNLGPFNPEAYARVLSHLLKDLAPRLVLLGNTSVGMDLAGTASAAMGATVVGNCVEARFDGGRLVITSKLYGGKLTARTEIDEGRVLILLMPGSYAKERGMKDEVPQVELRAPPEPLAALRIRFREILEPAAADVDLTKTPILVAAGRGIQDRQNLEMLTQLADLLGGAVCGTRPVIDQGWLPRSRQVGRSGSIVKPRLYLALGISGAPEHVEGMKDSELVVAVNTDPGAPIFDVAHYGAVADALEVVPALLESVKGMRGV